MTTLRFGLLGPVCTWRSGLAFAGSGGAGPAPGDGEEIDLGPIKQRAVLAVLLLNANQSVPVATIVGAVWGDEPPGNGPNVVQKHVSGLRRALEPDRQARLPSQLLTLTEAGYTIRVEPGALDVDAFRAQVEQAYQARAAGALPYAVDTLRAALSRWRGTALAGLSGSFFAAERERLTELRMSAIEESVEMEMRLGRHVQLVPQLQGLVAEHPSRERLRGLLMTALHHSGRPTDSLAVYQDGRDQLVDELGIEPGADLRRLHQQIASSPARPPVSPAPAMAPDAPAAPPPPSGLSWTTRLLSLWLPLVPFLTVGLLAWIPAAYGAARLRSRVHGAIAAVYMLLTGVVLVFSTRGVSRLSDFVFSMLFLIGWMGGTAHAVFLRSKLLRLRKSLLDPLVALARERRHRREGALELLRREPSLARDLRIGRPDLPRQYDDGGLIDVNGVPEHVLTTALGLTIEQARGIVLERERIGGFASVRDLAKCGLLQPAELRTLRDVLIVVR
ncbi:winged helix-turn-helix domain-containing protein [Micromonospora sp. CPCC 205371]|nr:winged helix-turn-helix domain-containing protein [Micromonospora sp. CPCC 205371]